MATTKNSISISLFFLFFLLLFFVTPIVESQFFPPFPIPGGDWVLLQSSLGISAMHMQLLHTDQIVIFDRTDFGPSNLSLPFPHCRFDPSDLVLRLDCTAHSILYDLPSNTFRPLTVQTDTWCSSAAVLPNGTLVQTGGYNDGDHVVRIISPAPNADWIELPHSLSFRRWYSTNQILPNGQIIIVGGRRAFTYEFYPRNQSLKPNYFLPFLKETRDFYDENNLYPFLHLLPDGNLFIFANTRSIILDWVKNRVLHEFPPIPGLDKRNYPSTGSSVLLPLKLSGGNDTQSPEVEVMVCGGAPPGAFYHGERGVYVGASNTCGRIKLSDPKPDWRMEVMPMGRVMSDMLLLPTGDIVIINGAGNGTAGWEMARNPVLNPVLYMPEEPEPARRFHILNPSPIPRLYHSSAVLVPDGRILVGGSNPHRYYNFTNILYPTELSLEAFSPHYLGPQFANLRPTIVSVSDTIIRYRQMFTVSFFVTAYHPEQGISVTLLAPSFTTHSFAMNQRLIVFNVVSLLQMATSSYQVSAIGPGTDTIAPPGYYLLFIVHMGIPSRGVWVKIES